MAEKKTTKKPTLYGLIKKLYSDAEGWEELETPVKGITVIKRPANKSKASDVALALNPFNGFKSKIFIESKAKLMKLANILTDNMEGLLKTMDAIEKVNGNSSEYVPNAPLDWD